MVWLLTSTGIQVWSGMVVYGMVAIPQYSCVCAATFTCVHLCLLEKTVKTGDYRDLL